MTESIEAIAPRTSTARERGIRILQVLGYARDGGRRSGITGVEKVVQLLVEGLPRERFASYLAYPAAGALRDRLGSRCSAMFDGEPRRWYDRRYVVELSDFIRQHGIELVVSHGLRFDWHAALAARRTAIPHVVVRPVALADEIMPASRRRLFALVDRWTLRSCAVVVAVSQASRLRMLRTQRVPAGKIVVIPNGVAIPVVSAAERAAARRKLDLTPEARIVGAVGQLIPRKSFDVMVQALGRIHDAHPDVVGVILGEGPERDRLAALARSLDVRLLLPGFVSDPRAVVASFEIAVLPSRAEGMPLAVLESMALGVATVATAVAGTPEVIEDGISGCLVPPSDPAALAQSLTRLLDDDAQRTAIADAGSQRIAAQFTLRGMLAAFGSLFEHTVART